MRACECNGLCAHRCVHMPCSQVVRAYAILSPVEFNEDYSDLAYRSYAWSSGFGVPEDSIIMLCTFCGSTLALEGDVVRIPGEGLE